jgi:hypothetical protein
MTREQLAYYAALAFFVAVLLVSGSVLATLVWEQPPL